MGTEPVRRTAVLSRRDVLRGSAAAGLGLALGACGSGGAGGGGGKISALFMQQAGYSVDNIRSMTAAFEKRNTGITIDQTFVSYEALHDKTVAAAPAGTYDVVLIDVIWPAEFASRHIVQDVTDRYGSSWEEQMFAGALKTGEYQGKYYGVPWILDTKYLFYNKKMLQEAGIDETALQSWEGVVGAARELKKQGVIDYPLIWSWSQAEALICDYATLLGAHGGRFLNESGKPAFQQGGGLAALDFMVRSLDEGLSDPSSTESLEEDVRKVFSQGKAAFAENWAYMYNLANDPDESLVAGDAKIARTPAGPDGSAPGVNGSMAVALATGTDKADAAWKYITHLTSRETQERYAKYALPVWQASYDDPKVIEQAGSELVAVAKEQLRELILRPQVTNYNAVSHELQVEIQNALLGRKTTQKALADAAKSAQELMSS